MTDETITISIKSPGDKKYDISVLTSSTISQLKEQIASVADIPADRQRLIYSGRVLKDPDTVSTYKIQSGHTVHLVKGAAPKSEPSPQPNAAPSVPTNISAGQDAGNPLNSFTSARYAGFNLPMPSESLFGPDGGMGPMPDESQIEQMFEQPMFQEGMRAMLSDPNMLDQLIQQSPQLRALGPQAREMLQSDYFRSMLTNPQMMRQMMSMQRAMRGSEGATPSFPMPGSATGENSNTAADSAGQPTGQSNPAGNPFAALLGNQPMGGFGDPAMLSSLFGGGAAAPSNDTRPPEERYETQLRQLNDMGFVEFERNVAALRRSGGSVEGAIEALLSGSV